MSWYSNIYSVVIFVVWENQGVLWEMNIVCKQLTNLLKYFIFYCTTSDIDWLIVGCFQWHRCWHTRILLDHHGSSLYIYRFGNYRIEVYYRYLMAKLFKYVSAVKPEVVSSTLLVTIYIWFWSYLTRNAYFQMAWLYPGTPIKTCPHDKGHIKKKKKNIKGTTLFAVLYIDSC